MRENKICGLNLSQGTVEYLHSEGINVYPGSLGKQVRLKYSLYGSSFRVSPQTDIPNNLHEYGKIIIDLTTESIVEYEYADHEPGDEKSFRTNYLICHRPQTLFDPTALVLSYKVEPILENALKQGALLVLFCGKNESIKYNISGDEDFSHEYGNYSFLSYPVDIRNRNGEILKAEKGSAEIYKLMSKYTEGCQYHVTFDLPRTYNAGKSEIKDNYFPLIYSHDNEVVSFYILDGKSGIFFFPDIDNKAIFLKEFFSEAAPELLPALFPNEVKDKWLEDERYSLPNQERLLLEKQKIIEDFKSNLDKKEFEIEENNRKYGFLRNLLTATGTELVTAVIKFLHWLGFDTAIDADMLESETGVFEEHIQIETDKGLIIIEVKGIGGTSTDSECSQIGKIRYRRAKQRNDFNVFPLYIVNHQRHLPADERVNPPFNKRQISDAVNDQRGMLTTWQLFNLYTLVEGGLLTKEELRACFYRDGYIDFVQRCRKFLGVPKEYYQDNKIVVMELGDHPKLKIGDTLIVVHKGSVYSAKLQSIQVDGRDIGESVAGELGLGLDRSIRKGSELYI